MIFVYIILGFLLFLLSLPIFLAWSSGYIYKQFDQSFEAFDKAYEQFIDKRLGYELLKKEGPAEFSRDSFLEDAILQLRPYSEKLFQEFEDIEQSTIHFVYESKYFSNLEQLGRLFNKHKKYKQAPKSERQLIWYNSFVDALDAHIRKRLLELELSQNT